MVRILVPIVGVLFWLAVNPTPTLAAVNLSMSPSTGTYSNAFTVGLYVSATPPTDQVAGISVNLNYSGPITYSSYSDGSSNCEIMVVNPSSGSIHIECLASLPEGYITAPGTIGNFTFIPTGTGTGSVQIDVDEIGFVAGTLGTVTGGTYMITSSGTTLPNAGIIDNPAIAAIFIVSAGLISFILTRNRIHYLLYGRHSRVIIRHE